MNVLHNGIVLRLLPNRNIIPLFDSNKGRIDAVCYQAQKYSSGVMLSYQLRQQGEKFFLESHKLINSPLLLAQDDILFLHHIIELVDLLVPYNMHEHGLFDLLQLLYTQKVLNSLQKKIIMCKLLTILGIFIEPAPKNYENFSEMPIDMMDLASLHLAYEYELDGWLIRCFSQHPLLYNIKTMQLLKAENFFKGEAACTRLLKS